MIQQQGHGVEVVDNHFQTGLIFYKYERGQLYIAKPVVMEYELVTDEFADIRPTIALPFALSRDLPMKLVEALERKGIISQTEARNQGELKATQAHLNDIRNIAQASLKRLGIEK